MLIKKSNQEKSKDILVLLIVLRELCPKKDPRLSGEEIWQTWLDTSLPKLLIFLSKIFSRRPSILITQKPMDSNFSSEIWQVVELLEPVHCALFIPLILQELDLLLIWEVENQDNSLD